MFISFSQYRIVQSFSMPLSAHFDHGRALIKRKIKRCCLKKKNLLFCTSNCGVFVFQMELVKSRLKAALNVKGVDKECHHFACYEK